jgi:hypothetical protein
VHDNPLEARFLKAWQGQNEGSGRLLDYLLGDGAKASIASDRDEKVAATVIQWLGSPVGQSFLSNVLGIQICTDKISVDSGKTWIETNS